MIVDEAGSPLDGIAWRLFFGIVNQVLVRLWARRWWDIRVNGCLPLVGRKCGLRGSRSLTGQGPCKGIQPSDRRHMCSEAFFTDLSVVMAI